MSDLYSDKKFEKFLNKYDKEIKKLCIKYLHEYPSMEFQEIYNIALTCVWKIYRLKGGDINWSYIKISIIRMLGRELRKYFDNKIINREIDQIASKYSVENEIINKSIVEKAINLAKILAKEDLNYEIYLMWLKGMTCKQIAEEKGMHYENVKGRLKRMKINIHHRLRAIYNLNKDKI